MSVDFVREIYNAMLNVDVNNTASGDAKKSLNLILEAMKLKTEFLRTVKVDTEEEMKQVFDSVFYARKHYDDVLRNTGVTAFSKALETLRDDNVSYQERVQKFVSAVKASDQEDIEDMARR